MDSIRILFDACESGDLDLTTRLLETATFDVVSIRSVDSRSLLDVAIDGKHIDIVKTLIPYEFDIVEALSRAIVSGNCEVVQLILDALPQVTSDILNDCLVEACKHDHVAVVNHLRAVAADLSIDVNLRKLLIRASTGDHHDVAKALLDAGVDVSSIRLSEIAAINDPVSSALAALNRNMRVSYDTEFHVAAENGYAFLIEPILAESTVAESTIVNSLFKAADGGHTGAVRAIMAGASVNPVRIYYASHHALRQGHTETATVLMDALPDRDWDSEHLPEAAEGGCVEIAKTILASSPEQQVLAEALHRASAPVMVRLLLDAKADVADRFDSVLLRSCAQHQLESVQMLLDAGAEVGSHALYLLSRTLVRPVEGREGDQLSLARLLLDKAGFGADEMDDVLEMLADRSVFSLAAVQLLLERLPALLHHRHTEGGFTLLSCAIEHGNAAAGKLLIDAGADLSTRDRKGMSVIAQVIVKTASLQEASEPELSDMHELLRALLAAGAEVDNCDDEGRSAAFYLTAETNPFSSDSFDEIAVEFLRSIHDSITARSAAPAAVSTGAAAQPREDA